jgi:hypothetical protein
LPRLSFSWPHENGRQCWFSVFYMIPYIVSTKQIITFFILLFI